MKYLLYSLCILFTCGSLTAQESESISDTTRFREVKQEVISLIKEKKYGQANQRLKAIEAFQAEKGKGVYARYSYSIQVARQLWEHNQFELSKTLGERLEADLKQTISEARDLSPEELAALYCDGGYLYTHILFEPENAVKAYRRALQAVPEHPGALKAIENLKRNHAHLVNE